MADKDDRIMSFQGRFDFLSNFYTSLVVMADGIHYPTAEHAFQAQKTTSLPERRLLAKLATPGRAKRAGRMLDLRPDWDSIKDDVMLDVIRAKFVDDDLARRLVKTGDRELIEGNTWGDKYWGCIVSGNHVLIGQNKLGRTLMAVREELRKDDV